MSSLQNPAAPEENFTQPKDRFIIIWMLKMENIEKKKKGW